tara:strand:+ start:68 stop:274 length:207 start_codon:yes stop_codon:yes gene_type:complete
LSEYRDRKDRESYRKESTLRVSLTEKCKLQHDNEKTGRNEIFLFGNLAMNKTNDDRSFIAGEKASELK